MGFILQDVYDKHLNVYIQEEAILKSFLSGFDVTYGTRRNIFNTELSVYILKPESYIIESYGVSNEIMLVYSKYSNVEPRTIQAADNILQEYPFKNRVDILSYFLITEDENIHTWLSEYFLDRQESRIIIPFSVKELIENRGNSWYIRNRLNQYFFDRDLFGYTLPLTDDTYFFGRHKLIANYVDSINRNENRGVFGLRKTGKTSLLFKLTRTLNTENKNEIFFYDCKSPSLRKLQWNEFLGEICKNIAQRIKAKENIDNTIGEIGIIKIFRNLLYDAKRKGLKIVLIFDEIEYISFKSLTDKHWESGYIDFWQTMWSAQSIHKNLVYVIAGVNPSIVEVDKINGIQNPLFGIVQYDYLKGLSQEDLKSMIKVLGKRMGLNFEVEAIEYMFKWYGGHPMLTRLACSWVNKDFQNDKKVKPITVTTDYLTRTQQTRDSDLIFYCHHVVSELKDFYPDEYEMLELLASGQTILFVQLSPHHEFIKHLKSYGLIDFDSNSNPKFKLPVIGKYIGIEYAKKEGRNTVYKIVETENRTKWIEQRKTSILRDLRMLEKIIQSKGLSSLFGNNSFPEADEFMKLGVVSSKFEFTAFVNICYRCFVESIDVYGKSISINNYYSENIKLEYEGLFYSLNRIKVYRNEQDHLVLRNSINEQLLEYLENDLESQNAGQVDDLYFVLQQRVLDGLLTGIHIELNKET
jgi:hypothetical protein